ncbi:hypothetical protein [Chelativorans sp. M5D2P16]|uniref:hypothetical protein n=1 Tax=Chelativorans sp. M5D2P16 TaxID=3095678 RepID=UPI002ACA000D|nr:hypothetical protein [Chelativorans sp. M5D2P16]MDZ5699054.1 hypothetical protein [Chelativorans sp. M5D2P16]
MKGKNDPRSGSARKPARDFPPEVRVLLSEIEKEPVPERLLELARQLQDALARKRAEEEEPSERHARQAGQR